MSFWKKKEKKSDIVRPVSKSDVLKGLQMCCTYFERNSKDHISFQPEYEVSKSINLILEQGETLTASDVVEVLDLFNGIANDHYDGTGWFDYQLRLSHYLRLSGFETKHISGQLHLDLTGTP
jgi:hypothetical protein